jgi:putative heme iron utilization protein
MAQGGDASAMAGLVSETPTPVEAPQPAPTPVVAQVESPKVESKHVIPKKTIVVQVDSSEEEPRDDFEGFGSITAMVQNKDVLVEK